MRRFPFDRLHHSARRQSRRHIQQQMHMIGSHMPLHDLDIQRSANLSRQIPHLFPDLSSQSRLAVLGDEHKVISQPIHCMRTFPILRHLRSVPPSLLKASPKGEGVHPSQSGTLRALKEITEKRLLNLPASVAGPAQKRQRFTGDLCRRRPGDSFPVAQSPGRHFPESWNRNGDPAGLSLSHNRL